MLNAFCWTTLPLFACYNSSDVSVQTMTCVTLNFKYCNQVKHNTIYFTSPMFAISATGLKTEYMLSGWGLGGLQWCCSSLHFTFISGWAPSSFYGSGRWETAHFTLKLKLEEKLSLFCKQKHKKTLSNFPDKWLCHCSFHWTRFAGYSKHTNETLWQGPLQT